MRQCLLIKQKVLGGPRVGTALSINIYLRRPVECIDTNYHDVHIIYIGHSPTVAAAEIWDMQKRRTWLVHQRQMVAQNQAGSWAYGTAFSEVRPYNRRMHMLPHREAVGSSTSAEVWQAVTRLGLMRMCQGGTALPNMLRHRSMTELYCLRRYCPD